MRRFQAVIFDMDGVLIDSERVIRRAAQLAGLDFGREIADAWFDEVIGLPGVRVEAALRELFGHGFPMDDYRLCFQRHYAAHIDRHGMQSKPGVPALLQDLTAGGVPIAVATQTRSGHAQAALASAGLLDYLPVCVTGDLVAAPKPAPDVFLRAAAELGVEPAACIALEDSEIGIRAAVAAGMWTLMIPDLKPASEEAALLVREILPSMPHAADRVRALLRDGAPFPETPA